jgi:hypothetical protein
MINGVLVERTVKEVVPALKTNSEGLKKVLDELVVQYKGKQDEMEKWKVSVAFRGRPDDVPSLPVLHKETRLIRPPTTEKEQHSSRAAVRLEMSSSAPGSRCKLNVMAYRTWPRYNSNLCKSTFRTMHASRATASLRLPP